MIEPYMCLDQVQAMIKKKITGVPVIKTHKRLKRTHLYNTKQSFSENTFFKQHTDDAIKNDDTW